MENVPQANRPISSDFKDRFAEEVHAEESAAEVVGVSRSLPTSLNEKCSSSAEMQRLPTPLCPPLAPDTQLDGTVQELQYGSQTDKEKSHSICQTNQIQPRREGAGPVDITGTKEKQSVLLEYKPETGTNVELGGKEHTGGNILLQPKSQICFTASSPSVPQSSVGFKVQDITQHGATKPSDRDPLVHANQSSHIPPPGAAEQTGGHQDSKSSELPLPSSGNSEIKQTDLSKTQPKIIKESSTDAREIQKANSLESVEMSEHVKELVDTSRTERRPPSAEILEIPKATESHPGLSPSPGAACSSTAAREDRDVQRSCDPPEGEQVESSVRGEQTDATASSSDFTLLPECSSAQESHSKPSAAPPLFDTGLVVSLPAGQVAEAETSRPPERVPATETPPAADLARSAEAQEVVVVREEAHISGDWSNMRLNQSYLLQREDGSVCEAAVVNELSSELSTGEPKLYEGSAEAGIELDSQSVEVYEFCTLVEEVAEETVCATSSAQIPHSPGYEVNLFNALLEHSEEYTVKEDIEPSIHTINESGTVIISQQPLPSLNDAIQIQARSNSNSHNLSILNTRVAAVGQHLVFDANQAVEVANSSEVCLVEVAAVTSDSFAVEQMDASPQIGTPCSQVSAAVSDQTTPQKQEAEATAGAPSFISPVVTGEDTEMESSVAVSGHVQPTINQTVVSATKPEANVSSHEGTKDAPALAETPSQRTQTVAMPAETNPEALCATHSGIINPKLLLLKPGETPFLKSPPSLLAKVSKQQNATGKLANAHSSWSGTVSEECLAQTVPESLCAPVALKTSVSAAAPVKVRQSTMSSNSLQLGQNAFVTPTTSSFDKEALNVTETVRKAGPASQDVVTLTDPTAPYALYVLSASEEREGAVTASTGLSDPVSQPDALYVEEESEDMEQDEPTGETEALEATSGQVSSPEEDSDEEPDADKESEMTTLSSPDKVRQWIADRVTGNSSPVSPSTSSSYPGPSPANDWSTPRREKSSLLRGPHGKFVSPSSGCGYSLSTSPPDHAPPQRPRGQADMAELAKHEADIEHRTQSLKREGFWSLKRLTRLTEPPRPKVHWDYLCEEMQWLSADFAQERRWKRGVARKVVRMVMRHHEDLRQKEEKAKRDEHAKIRRVASSIAKEVRAFWSSVEKVVQYKQQSRLEEKRKKALDLQLDFIVGQTEKYSDLLSKSLAHTRLAEPEPQTVPQTPKISVPPAVDEDDRDFEPPYEEEDDEETIEVEEQQEGNDAESHQREIELLKEEGMLPLDQLLSTLKRPPQESGSDEECSDESSSSVEEEDGEFTANEEDAEDEEDTIDAQEKVEGNVDHAEELDDLAKEGDMSVEELLEKYKGAYASDFEAPSASGSKESSDSELSGDEEEETEEDESDVESNTSSSESPGDSGEDDDSEKDEEESEEEDDDCGDEGMEVLLKEGDNSPPASSSRPKKEISHIAATAESLQPKGYTLATTKVKTPIPFLLDGTLREYQHIGLDWLVTMFEKKLNGILADEMGLGKTIQTIALLAHLACEKGNWGPHLIIVPTSVMLNWEMELKRWCPGFKILTYFGSQKERKLKRQGWTKPNAFHVCITSYKLVLQDHQAFRRKSWRYLILDEAQNIKNFKSQRWQSLLNFNSHRRLLLTGTPLQNSLMELWSLMHFLMPHVFQSHREFKEWFSNPLTGMIEGSQEYNEGLVKRLHKVLRPFLLRRIKIDVEKQMPKKYEHVVRCRLSKRQRFLYDDFMAQASTRETLASGHFMSVINILMQLRKVCNHPNLFDPRPIQSPFITKPIVFHTASLVQDALEVSPLKRCDLSMFDLVGLESRVSRYQADVFLPRHKVSRQLIQEIMDSPEPLPRPRPVRMKVNRTFQPPPKSDNRAVLLMNKPTCSVPPAAQTPKPPPVTEVPSTPAPAPVVQQVVCTVSTSATPRPSMHLSAQTAVRASAPKPVLSVRPPAAPCTAGVPAHPSPNPGSVLPQRVLLSPDMQARLPSGEVVSIAQLASLAGRPVSSCQGSKPVTFQLQGNKLTLSGAQIHQVPAASPRPVHGNVMHLVSSGVQHHLISQPAQLAVQSAANTHPANTSTAPPTNRLPHNAVAQVPPAMVSSHGVVKIVVRQTAGKDGEPVPTLAVAPSPRVAPHTSLSPQPHASTTSVRNTAPLQIVQRTPGPATAHYTIAPPGTPSSTPNQPHPLRPVLTVVQPPPSSTEQPAPVQLASSSSASKASSSSAPRDSSSQTPVTTKSRPSTSAKAFPPPRRVPRPPPRSPFHMPWLADCQKQQRDSRLDFIIRVNENHCAAKPMYGREVLNFLTFLPGPRPSPAAPSSKGEWGRSGHSSCLFAQWQNKYDFWLQSHAVREAIHSIDDRLELLNDLIDRFTFAIPPVEAPPISMHCCHPPPSVSHKQAVFSTLLSAQVTPLTRSLHRIQCYMRTQFPDLRLIQYDCGKLQTLHTLLRKLKTGGHRVLIFTQMTRMLDVLEQFLNYHGHIYLRLDGSTRVEQRQSLMERFNADRRIFCFILSTRSGGVGVNLTGADTVVFYDSDWNPTMDAQAQDRCHRIGQTRDVHIYRLISERTVEENILKKANQKRMLGDMAIEGGNFTTAFFKQQTIRELFDMNEGERRDVAVELSVPQPEEEEAVNKQSTTILEQALCRAEDEEDIVAASQAKAEQVAELAEFNENIPLDDGGEQEEVEELSKAEQEIAALVEQLTPIERYAMNFLEASLEDVCKEELKQAEEQVEAARKGLDQAKEEGLKLHASSDDEDDDFLSPPASVEPAQPARRGRKPKDKDKVVPSTRISGRLRGASPETESETSPREVPERLRCGLRGRGSAKDAASTTPSRTDHHKTSSSTRLQDSSKSSKASSPARDHQTIKTRPSPPTTSPPGGKPQCAGETDGKTSKACREEKDGESERRLSESSLESSCPLDQQAKDEDTKDNSAMSLPSTSSRSPRKRQSADGEVLRGLVEDSPSAKVLRKLPGRLVTVVEEKEPRRRRRRGSGTGGGASPEEAAVEENAAGLVDEPNKDNTSPLGPDCKTKGAVNKSPQDQDSTPSQPVHPPPVRSYPPYSPPHLSPDMPVLRNLPVRRRLETESRMAAQLVEQQQQLGRGRGGNQSRKTDMPPGKDSSSTESSVNSLVTPLKRKRGRPPKTPPTLPESDNTVAASPQPTLPVEEGNPPLSPKRKRGRPRKDSTTTAETVSEGHNSKNETTTAGVSGLSKTDASTESTVLSPHKSETPIAAVVTTSRASQSTKNEETDTKTKVSAPAPNPEGAPTTTTTTTTTDKASTPTVTASVKAPTAPAPLPVVASASALAQFVSSATAPSSDTASAQVSSASSVTLSMSAVSPVAAPPTSTTPVPPASAVAPTLADIKPTLVVSSAPKAPVDLNHSGYTTTDSAKTTTVSTPAAVTPSTVSSSSVAVGAVPTTTTEAASVKSKTVSVTPAVTTTVTSKTMAVEDLPQASALSSTSTPAAVSSAPTATQKVSATTSTPAALSSAPAAVSSAPTSLSSAPTATQTVSAITFTPATVSAALLNTESSAPVTASCAPCTESSAPATVSSAPACVTSAPAALSCAPAATQTVSATATSPASISPQPTSSPPSKATTRTTTTTTVKAIQARPANSTRPSTVPTASPTMSTSSTPSVTTVSSSAANTVPSSSAQAKTTVTTPKVPTKPVSTSPPVQVATQAQETVPAVSTSSTKPAATPTPTSTPSPTTKPASVTTTAETVTVTSSSPTERAEGVPGPTPVAAAAAPSSKEHTTSTTPATTAEKTVEIPPPPVRTSTGAPVTTTPSPEKSITVATTNVPTTQASTTTATPVSVATVAATAAVSTTQASAVVSPQVQSSASTDVSPDVSSPAQTEALHPLPTSASSSVSSEKRSSEPTKKVSAPKGDPDRVTEMEVDAAEPESRSSKEEDDKQEDTCESQPHKEDTCESQPNKEDTSESQPHKDTCESQPNKDTCESQSKKEDTCESQPNKEDTCESQPNKEDTCESQPNKEDTCESQPNKDICESQPNKDTCESQPKKDICEAQPNKEDICESQPKRRKVESSSETKDVESGRERAGGDAQPATATPKEKPKQQPVEQTTEDQKTPIQKRPLSRQSSQESAQSSSSSSTSTSTLTRHAHHKRTYENRHPAKKRRMDVTSETGKEEKTEEGGAKEGEGGKKALATATSRGRRSSSSSSSSSDSDNGESRKERRLTRSAKHGLQDQEREKGNSRQGKKPSGSSDRNASNNANASTGAESGSDTSSVRITRKTAGSQPPQDGKAQTNSVVPPEPEVLGKRCSALNAAAKLLAMKGRVDTPGHTPRKDSGAKAAGTSPASSSSSDKNQKPKSKSVPASPQSNSVNLTNNKSTGSKPSTPNQTSRPVSRSTRQCPGSLVPPLEAEYKRSKAEEKERGGRKSSGGKEGEAEAQSSSRVHSACSSVSSDGEGDGGGRSSRSRSSSNSSQRTRSVSSQNTERRESRATSSGSERDRSSESRGKRDQQGQHRESRKGRRSHRLSQEVNSSSGTEGTPDRVLRSVAALAAVQARSPAASTRSSSGQNRHNKT
ncbi:helicase SRCAP isoform X2 [Perca flavescens]|uniref:helicase SRCAP isoform X2 n=1 Tax=Perca flavescens TaxID=8167 RepID=UPI00106E928C|nr:helicase SRCAP isoform X2 [Perca flavescens]